MTTPRRGLLFHFTHLTNLESVAATGLVADNQVRLDGRLQTEVGNRRLDAGALCRAAVTGRSAKVEVRKGWFF